MVQDLGANTRLLWTTGDIGGVIFFCKESEDVVRFYPIFIGVK